MKEHATLELIEVMELYDLGVSIWYSESAGIHHRPKAWEERGILDFVVYICIRDTFS